jgi:hypothetical protein
MERVRRGDTNEPLVHMQVGHGSVETHQAMTNSVSVPATLLSMKLLREIVLDSNLLNRV